MAGGKLVWKLVGTGSAIAAASVTRKVVTAVWGKAVGGTPPTNPESDDTTWPEALAWTALTGVAIALARLAATKVAATGWRRAMGELPPGLEKVGSA